MTHDHTAAARKARQRLKQLAAGMKRVEEIVPEDCVQDLRDFAQELRKQGEGERK